MSIHRLVKRADIEVINNEEKAFNPLLEVLKRRSKNTVECKVVNDGYVSNRQKYGQFTCVESSLCNVSYVTIRITNAQMKVVINDMNNKHKRIKLNYSKSIWHFGDSFYKSFETPPPYVMLYNNKHRIFIDVKALWWLDDMVFLCESKEALHFVLDMTGLCLATELKVEFKANWQIYPVDDRGIDYCGFLQNHYNVLLRKSILLRFYRKASIIAKKCPIKDENDIKHLFPSEWGWTIRCSEAHKKNVFNKIINDGHKYFINGSAVSTASASDRPVQQRTGNIPLQLQHKGSGGCDGRNGRYTHSQRRRKPDRQDVAV